MSESYSCSICRDAKVVHPRGADGKPDYSQVVPCQCAREELERRKAQWLLTQCELPPFSETMTFETFQVVRGTEKAYKLAQELAEGRGDVMWLTFMGPPATGKTHLAVAIAHRWLQRSVPAKYSYVPLLLDELRRGQQQEGDNSYDTRFQMFCDIPLLVLDDLGTEYQTPWALERLDTIIDYRLMHNLALVVTTNLTMDKLPFRLSSRFDRCGFIITIDASPYKSRKTRDKH